MMQTAFWCKAVKTGEGEGREALVTKMRYARLGHPGRSGGSPSDQPNDVSVPERIGTWVIYFFLASAGLGRPELVLNGDAGAAGFFSCLGFFVSRLLRT